MNTVTPAIVVDSRLLQYEDISKNLELFYARGANLVLLAVDPLTPDSHDGYEFMTVVRNNANHAPDVFAARALPLLRDVSSITFVAAYVDEDIVDAVEPYVWVVL